jgi:hypothetical protein
MNFIARIIRPALSLPLRASFAKDNWKERDESAEKVYISQEESIPLPIQKRPLLNFSTKLTRVSTTLLKSNYSSNRNSKLFSRNTVCPVKPSKQKSTISTRTCDIIPYPLVFTPFEWSAIKPLTKLAFSSTFVFFFVNNTG